MESIVTFKRAVTVVGVSAAIICASAAGYFFFGHRKGRTKRSIKARPSSKKRQISPKSVRNNKRTSRNKDWPTSDEENSEREEESSNEYSSDSCSENGEDTAVRRRPRKGQRRHAKSKTKRTTSLYEKTDEENVIVSPVQQEQIMVDQVNTVNEQPAVTDEIANEDTPTTDQLKDEDQLNQGKPEEHVSLGRSESTASSEAEIASNTIERETTGSNGRKITPDACDVCRHVHYQQQETISPAVSSIKSHCADSPSVGSDMHSDASQDSGKGASMVQSSMTPVEEMIEVPPIYEFEVPRDIVGLLIGKKGTTIKWLTEQSEAYIVIRDHFFSDKHKICTLEGTREQINKCLRLIRRKFPPSRFPELRLTPILPPPVSTPKTPVWDNVVQLNLPESVNCEVAISSIVNVGHVFVQQPTHPTFPSLARLDQYMLAVYGQPAGVPALPHPIELAVICAAPVLGGWYRAQVIDYYEDTDEALVKFVDYGGYSRVSAADLRQIRSDFMTLPFQATECYLANIAPADEAEGWSQDALSLFEQLSLGKIIEAKVNGHASDSNVPLVELYAWTKDSKSVMINRLLVEDGYAVWTD